jgi:hypothetical protein
MDAAESGRFVRLIAQEAISQQRRRDRIFISLDSYQCLLKNRLYKAWPLIDILSV